MHFYLNENRSKSPNWTLGFRYLREMSTQSQFNVSTYDNRLSLSTHSAVTIFSPINVSQLFRMNCCILISHYVIRKTLIFCD